MDDLKFKHNVVILTHELTFSASKSSGPGGQHVNKTNSKATLSWDFASNASLSLSAKDRLVMLAGSKVKADGSLQLSSGLHRSHKKNKEECVSRLRRLVLQALNPPKKRKPTKVPKRKKEERMKAKKKHAEKKSLRKKPRY